ncbi:MAG: hypothetical protein PHP30_02475 [Bacteroidales bacterium]|nr:hypothetical protein [Bacteroidales bacterium]MDD3988951.1 hypothetical protein [Bacteroidales bacterium]MDD4638501.1 hypothetical protein [Bacteroidales bacterium]
MREIKDGTYQQKKCQKPFCRISLPEFQKIQYQPKQTNYKWQIEKHTNYHISSPSIISGA